MKNYCTFYLVRHGETVMNTQKIMQGHIDSPLTEKGVSQVQETKRLLKDVLFHHAASSDLLRAKRTAEIIAEGRNLDIHTHELLREMHFGKFEGKKLSHFLEKLKDKISERDSLAENAQLTYKIDPLIESYEEASDRMLTYLQQAVKEHAGKTALVVSHSNMIRSTLVRIGFARSHELPSGAIKNASYVVIQSDGNEYVVKEAFGITKQQVK